MRARGDLGQLALGFAYAPRYVVCFSGGHSSALVAVEVVRRYGRNGVVLLNHEWDALKGSIEEYKRSKTAASPSAVLITGNPKYIKDNPAADKFYEAIEQDLKAKGYTVRRDPGEPYTSPPNANLWIGHSRGADRLRFAPSGTRTLAFGSNAKGAINHPDDVVEMSAGHVPPAAHYVFTPEMADAIHSVKTASDRGLVKVPYQTNFPFPSKTRLHHDLSVKAGDTLTRRIGDYREAFVAEMRESYRRDRGPWQRLLARERVVLVCYCPDAEHCHRALLGRVILPALGATWCGDLVCGAGACSVEEVA